MVMALSRIEYGMDEVKDIETVAILRGLQSIYHHGIPLFLFREILY